jgi:hypothetical protein
MREFWIKPEAIGRTASGKQIYHCSDSSVDETYGSPIHVIEKSAYDDLKSEFTKYKLSKSNIHHQTVKYYEAKLAIAVEALEIIFSEQGDRDAEVALEKIKANCASSLFPKGKNE